MDILDDLILIVYLLNFLDSSYVLTYIFPELRTIHRVYLFVGGVSKIRE